VTKLGLKYNLMTAKLGLKYNLMTAYTSFIAIDNRFNSSNSQSHTVKQPLPMPANVNNSAVGAELSIEGVTRKVSKFNAIRTKVDSVQNSRYNPWDTMFVWSKRGLNLRSEPNTKSKIVDRIPFGTEVIIINKSDIKYSDDMVDNSSSRQSHYGSYTKPFIVEGNWVRIVTKTGTIGFVIDQYLLPIKPFNKTNFKSTNLNIELLNIDSISVGFGPFVKYGTYLKEIKTYKYGIKSIVEKESDGGQKITYEFSDLSPAEVFVLVISSWENIDNLVVKNISTDSITFSYYNSTIQFNKVSKNAIVGF